MLHGGDLHSSNSYQNKSELEFVPVELPPIVKSEVVNRWRNMNVRFARYRLQREGKELEWERERGRDGEKEGY
ncbi:unnamed protein product [Prunus armeniaca]